MGCKVNKYELDAILESFEEKGHEIVDFDAFSDVYIISTCAVTALAEKKSRKMIGRARRQNQNAVIVAVGCYIQKEQENIQNKGTKLSLDDIDILIGTKDKAKILERILAFTRSNQSVVCIEDVSHYKDYEEMSLSKTYDRTRAYVKVQDGCNNFCSYCIIPYVRGRNRSRNKEEIIEEVRRLVSHGVKEVVITGIEVASYGSDRGITLMDLLEEMEQVEELHRIRLSSLEQSIVDERFIVFARRSKKLCNHFHLSLQSGSNSVLNRMNRKYNIETYKEKVALLKQNIEGVAITTDIIVGFPEETEEEFEASCGAVRDIGFSKVHIFTYSIREGTVASKMNQVTDAIKRVREKTLEKVTKQSETDFKEQFMGKKLEVLFEQVVEIEGEWYELGHTTNYLEVLLPKQEKTLANQFVKIKLTGTKGPYMRGEISE